MLGMRHTFPETLVKMWFEKLNEFEQIFAFQFHAAILMKLMKKLNGIPVVSDKLHKVNQV